MIVTSTSQKKRLKGIDLQISQLKAQIIELEKTKQAYVTSILDSKDVSEGEQFEQTTEYDFKKKEV